MEVDATAAVHDHIVARADGQSDRQQGIADAITAGVDNPGEGQRPP